MSKGLFSREEWKIQDVKMEKEEGRDSVWGLMEEKRQQRGSGTHISNKGQPLSSPVSVTVIRSCLKTSGRG